MAKKAEHTKTPWAVSESNPYRVLVANGNFIDDQQGDDICIADCSADIFADVTEGATAANAAFIVLACNAHADLVAACKAMVIAGENIRVGKKPDVELAESLAMARAALVKAEAAQ
jgi:hypothetical protein